MLGWRRASEAGAHRTERVLPGSVTAGRAWAPRLMLIAAGTLATGAAALGDAGRRAGTTASAPALAAVGTTGVTSAGDGGGMVASARVTGNCTASARVAGTGMTSARVAGGATGAGSGGRWGTVAGGIVAGGTDGCGAGAAGSAALACAGIGGVVAAREIAAMMRRWSGILTAGADEAARAPAAARDEPPTGRAGRPSGAAGDPVRDRQRSSHSATVPPHPCT
jgi:hypothetical protein